MRIYLDRYFYFYVKSTTPWVDVPLQEPARLSDVLAQLGIPTGEVHLAVVNDQALNPKEVVLHPGDQVKLFPPFGGG